MSIMCTFALHMNLTGRLVVIMRLHKKPVASWLSDYVVPGRETIRKMMMFAMKLQYRKADNTRKCVEAPQGPYSPRPVRLPCSAITPAAHMLLSTSFSAINPPTFTSPQQASWRFETTSSRCVWCSWRHNPRMATGGSTNAIDQERSVLSLGLSQALTIEVNAMGAPCRRTRENK
ncbi:hypothetical protein BC939DRAFT_495070 [Gamsiella multidivaricata]|uniref:uncharacterized protein n=1 Tax=Gamsiella multidivaricata TaxID=101098 RepID=UPI002221090A|nr:uncharacterized protein BC939DRAFT_495070 [Gamsiella multidivaricata]KAI7819703.1 hypothetical protein BC939DRAFT_495070 [Gamsiella multidivaricata]